MAPLDNGAQINTIMTKYVSDHSLQMGPIANLLGAKGACVGLGNAYMRPLGYVVICVQVDGVQGYDEDQISLVILDLTTGSWPNTTMCFHWIQWNWAVPTLQNIQ